MCPAPLRGRHLFRRVGGHHDFGLHRLFRADRWPGGVVDTVLRRLILVLAVMLVGLTAAPRVARADALFTYDQAMAACQSFLASGGHGVCKPYTLSNGVKVICPISTWDLCSTSSPANPSYEGAWTYWAYTGDGPPSQCSSRISLRLPFSTNISLCKSGCQYTPVTEGSDGPVKHCVSGAKGTFCSSDTMMRPTGAECEGGPGSAPAPVQPPVPNNCGGVSCHDTLNHKYCAVNGSGESVCTPEPSKGASGGCVTGGDTTLCVGSPLPPKPPAAAVPDPATQIKGSDQHTDTPLNASTGQPTGSGASSTVVNNYGSPDKPADSGQQSGDSGPAPASSSAGGDKGAYSGGSDCNTPPACTGDAVLCGIGRQDWAQSCQLHNDLTDTGTVNDADTSVPNMDGLDGTIGPEKRTLLDRLDFSGFGSGGGVCPKFLHISVPALGIDYEPDPEYWCQILRVFGQLFMLFCTYEAMMILGRR